MKNWDDARYLLAVARADTFSAAANSLGVNQTTVSRRIDRLEQELGLTLFSLNNGHLEATATGAAILEECLALESAAAQLEQRILSQSKHPIYHVVLATTEHVSKTLLAPNIGKFRKQHKNIYLTLLTGQQNVRLDQGEADLAIRLKRPRAGRYKVRKLADFEFAVYQSTDQINCEHPNDWLGYPKDMSQLPEAQWMSSYMNGVEPIMRTNDVASLAEAVAAGAGIAMLPCRLGDNHPGLNRHPRLNRADKSAAPVNREAWLLIREDIHQYPHIRAVADWVVEAYSARA